MFITLEGTEGSGKSTQAAILRDALAPLGPVLLTREPGGTELGERIRRLLLEPGGDALDPVTELLLFSAARAQLVREVVVPALQRGEVVICDRYADSTRAYQGRGQGVAEDEVEAAIRLATGGLEPDLTIYLDVDAAEALSRRSRHRGDAQWNRIDARDLEFHERVRRGYLEVARRFPYRIVVVDAGRPIGEVAAEIERVVLAGLAHKSAGGTT